MMFSVSDTKAIRADFRKKLKSGQFFRYAGSFSPLVSRLIEECGFEGVYVSGAVISSDLALPDIELSTLSELAARGASIIKPVALPSLADADTGFGSLLNVARTVSELEHAGFGGLHLEDQKSPKKCGHLDNKQLISSEEMGQKIKIAVQTRQDPNFLIIARTDARGVEGVSSAIHRAKAYIAQGAEAIFPEALETREEFIEFRKAVSVPLVANMTEFGKSEILSVPELKQIGYNMVLYPVSAWRWALQAVKKGLQQLSLDGHQKNLLDQMLTRQELYKLLKYDEYISYSDKGIRDKNN